jgi:phosphatidylglycerophosphatase A
MLEFAIMWNLFAICYGVGKIKYAPGTFGSLVGLALAVAFAAWLDYEIASAVTLILTAAAFFSADYYCKVTGKQDPKEVVIDEVIGQLVAYLVCIAAFWLFMCNGIATTDHVGTNYSDYSVIMFFGMLFVTFRFFDILKPWPISWLDKNISGGMGVMIDDIVAGIFAGIVSALAFLAF